MTDLLKKLFETKKSQLNDRERALVIRKIGDCRIMAFLYAEEQIAFFQNLPVFRMRDGQILSLIEVMRKFDGFFFQPLYSQAESTEFWEEIDRSGCAVITQDWFGRSEVFEFYGKDEDYLYKKEYENAILVAIFENYRHNLIGTILAEQKPKGPQNKYLNEVYEQLGQIYVREHEIEVRPRDVFDREDDDSLLVSFGEREINIETQKLEERRAIFHIEYAAEYLKEKGLSLDSIKQRGQVLLDRYNSEVDYKEFKVGDYSVLREYIYNEIKRAYK